MPYIAVTRNDRIALVCELLRCFPEFVERTGAAADDLGDFLRIVRSENILRDRASVDKAAAGCLISESIQIAVCIRADINCILCDIRIFQRFIDIYAQILVRHRVILHVALCVFQDESGLCAVHIRLIVAACLQCLIKCRLISAVGCRDDRRADFIRKIRMIFQIVVNHARNFVRECPEIDRAFLAAVRGCGFNRLCSRFRGSSSLFCSSFCRGFRPCLLRRCLRSIFLRAGASAAGEHGRCHDSRQNHG